MRTAKRKGIELAIVERLRSRIATEGDDHAARIGEHVFQQSRGPGEPDDHFKRIALAVQAAPGCLRRLYCLGRGQGAAARLLDESLSCLLGACAGYVEFP